MSVISVYQFKTTLTADAGTVSINIPAGYKEGRQLIVIPVNASTEYDLALTDRNSIEVYHPTDLIGEWNDTIDNLVTVGNYTLTIRNSTVADEIFTVLLTMIET